MKPRLSFIFILLLLVQMRAVLAAPANCLRYEPETVTVTGKLHRETFPGRPNYESVANGDEPETGFYMSLEPTICTVGDIGQSEVAFKSVREIQLVLNKKQYAELRPKLGAVVRLRGQLFSAFTGHHHADVLLRVSE
ncbi:DUF4431 domain-containing protein [Collimonas arenae]|nr:DUF4431 domain-containing protein [Collimonas arenae]